MTRFDASVRSCGFFGQTDVAHLTANSTDKNHGSGQLMCYENRTTHAVLLLIMLRFEF